METPMNFDQTLLSEATRNALAAARDALANDPANQLVQIGAQAAGGKLVGLSILVTLGEPSTNDATPAATTPTKTRATTKPTKGDYGTPASEVRAKALAAGFDLGDRSLRSKADKEQALAAIEAFVANGGADETDDEETTYATDDDDLGTNDDGDENPTSEVDDLVDSVLGTSD